MIYNVTKIFGREEASKREREKAVQRMREQNERKVGRDREKFVKEEEIMHFKALLSEKVQYGSSVCLFELSSFPNIVTGQF